MHFLIPLCDFLSDFSPSQRSQNSNKKKIELLSPSVIFGYSFLPLPRLSAVHIFSVVALFVCMFGELPKQKGQRQTRSLCTACFLLSHKEIIWYLPKPLPSVYSENRHVLPS